MNVPLHPRPCRSSTTATLVQKAVRASVQVKVGQGERTIDEFALDHSAALVTLPSSLKPFSDGAPFKHSEIPDRGTDCICVGGSP
jgi:hypothetical protein